MARKATHALIQMLLPLVGFAQITLENEIALPVYSVITLTDGTKLLPSTPSTNSCVIYNVDFTPYRTLQFPTLPAEFDWFGPPTYITQSLFDTDESTIEYLLFGSAPDGTAMVVVGREDGSMVFSADGRISARLGGGLSYSPGIFATSTGTKMIITSSFDDATRIYSLPGSVPCVASCQPAATNYITGGVGDGILPVPGSSAFPNPTSERINIPYSLPLGETQGLLLLRDAAGRVVLERRLKGSGKYELEIGQLPDGVYPYTIVGQSGVLSSSRIVVMR